jgi:PAS domain S-box-containing protein
MFDWESVFNVIDVGVIVIDEHLCIAGWNEWIAKTTELSASSVRGRNLFEVFEGLKTARLESAIADAFQFGTSTLLTHSLNKLFPLRNEVGQDLVHNVIVRPLSASRITHCVLQITDVTFSVARERVLRDRQNARYHAIVDSAPDAIITTSSDRKIQWFNAAAGQIFGLTTQDLREQTLDSVITEQENLTDILAAHDAEDTTSGSSIQVQGLKRDGISACFEVSFAGWSADGRRFITTIWRDVTERVMGEKALRVAREALRKSNEELEQRVIERTNERELALRQLHESQKMETIGQLTGGVAHDFNNLLAVILGSLSLLKKGLPSDPRTSRLLDGAIQGAERGATLTKRLLAFARRQELKLEAVEMQKLIPEMHDFLRQTIGPAISIIVDIPNDTPPVRIDANQLELALMNLAVNSRDAMPNGGTLTISCRASSTETSAVPPNLSPGDYVRISISDTGEGMSDTTLAKAMEPFFTTKGVGKGTGLGLSMVHGLTAQCGGAMTIASRLGRGTTVTLWLPMANAVDLIASPILPTTQASSQASKQLRVLLVDDDFLVRANTALMVSDLGHTVVEASSGKSALELLQQDSRIEVVMTDYLMPGMNGIDLANAIRVSAPHLPIILTTGYADLQSSSDLGFPRLPKPYTQDQLAEILDAVINSR